MSNYESHILPALQQLSSPASEPISVAYVVANSVGKSTVLVPDLWKHVKATRPDAQGLYILSNQEEAELVVDDIAEREAAEVINEVPDADSRHKLGLVSFDHFNELMTGSEEASPVLRHQDAILFADVDHIPTVSGEISIGILVNWIQRLRSLEDVKVTIVLLACNDREDVDNVFYSYDIRATCLRWEEDAQYDEQEIESYEEIVDILLPILNEPTHGGAAPYVAIFAPLVEMTSRIMEPLHKFSNEGIRYVSIDKEIPKLRIREITGVDKPTVLFNLRCAISLPHKCERVFDASTISKSAKKGGHRPTLYTMWDSEWFQANKSKDNVVASATFGSLAYPSVPVPALGGSSSLIAEMRRRLVIMGCIDKAAPISRITAFGARVLHYVRNKEFNRFRNIHVAHLLAQIETGRELSLRSKRVLIRMAALTTYRPWYTLTDEATEKKLGEDCVGVGKQNAHYGQLWCELGIWSKLSAERSIQHALVDGAPFIERAAGLMRVMVDSCQLMDEYVTALEDHLGLDRCDNLIAETKLEPREQRQMVSFVYEQGLPPRDLALMRLVHLGVLPSGRPEDGGFFAIYQDSAAHEGILEPLYLTMLPKEVSAWMVERLGAQYLLSLVSTTYPVPTS
ncbi:uncharacterized protein F4812DRAFT_470795 [Daldinia caldariorum]|uniref:uncharacterized protein n=1 Tax=Daldinia caldariorum TaxID=326644 RepID=UPI0020075506|nr:uncharacterized protein F4812DRAFT_470795 [Daldinia caldariorum]KAI1469056.1 hypothetical protein F4812DRAFT_470795 [Daldinia caldariorum]